MCFTLATTDVELQTMWPPACCIQVIVNYNNADLSPRERAMLDFAMAVCRSDTITEQHFKALEEHGFDHEDAWDIAAIAAFFAMSNRLAHLTDMRPNAEFYNMGRVPRNKSKDVWPVKVTSFLMLPMLAATIVYVVIYDRLKLRCPLTLNAFFHFLCSCEPNWLGEKNVFSTLLWFI